MHENRASKSEEYLSAHSLTAEVADVVCRMLQIEDVVCLGPSLLLGMTALRFTMAEVDPVLLLFV